MEKFCLRIYIRTQNLLGLNATEIHNEFMDKVLFHIIKMLNGLTDVPVEDSLEDDSRQGPPMAVITQQTIDAVAELVSNDPHIRIDYIAYILGISHESISTILKHHLKLKKRLSRWVSHELTLAQRQCHVEN